MPFHCRFRTRAQGTHPRRSHLRFRAAPSPRLHLLAAMTTALILLVACSRTPVEPAADLTLTVEAQKAEIDRLQGQVTQLSADLADMTARLAEAGVEPDQVPSISQSAANLPLSPVQQPSAAVAPNADEPAVPPADTPAPVEPPASVEPQPTPTRFPPFEPGQISGDAPADRSAPLGILSTRWFEDTAVRDLLGWAVDAQPRSVDAVVQRFEHGLMVWREDTRTITIFYTDDQSWQVYPDTFEEGEPERDPTLYPQHNLVQPVRGFGKIWRVQPDVRERLGWALEKESPSRSEVQEFERGLYLQAGIERLIAGHLPDGAPKWQR